MAATSGEPERVDALLAAPLGRRLVAELSGVRFGALLDDLGLPYPPNIGRFTNESQSRGRRARALSGRHIRLDPIGRTRRSVQQATGAHRAAVLGVTSDDAAGAVRRVMGNAGGSRRVDVGDSAAVLEALRHTIRGYGFWGHEQDYDRLLTAATGELRPVAEALLGSSVSAWWWDDLVRDAQRFTTRATGNKTGPLRGAKVSEQVKEAAKRLRTDEERASYRNPTPGDVPENASGDWWSIPIPGTWTSRPVPPLPAFHLACAEDAGDERVVVWSLRIAARATVYEIRTPSDWGRLVETAPVDVTMSRLGDWRRWTGTEGPFYLPDWRAVAEHFDGVHLTTGGHLAARSVAVRVADGFSVLAGWDPDTTLWLSDVFEATDRLGEYEGPFSFRDRGRL